MKKILLSLTLVTAFLSFSTKALADACGVTNLKAEITNRTSTTDCSVTSITFNLEFDMSSNNGQKAINLIVWQTKDYPSFSYSGTTFPTPAYLAQTNAFAILSLINKVPVST